MKRTMNFAITLLALTMPAAMRAQDPPPTPAQAPAQADDSTPAPARTRTPEQLLKFYDSKLTLTDDQKDQLKPLIADRQQKLQALRADTTMRPRDRMKKAEAIEQDSDKKMNAVLTPDQQKKYADLEKQMREQARQRRQQGQGSSN